MIRKLFILASVLSLLLCLAAAVLWLQSYRSADELSWANPAAKVRVPSYSLIVLVSDAGRVQVYRRWGDRDAAGRGGFSYYTARANPTGGFVLGAVYAYRGDPEPYRMGDWSALGIRHAFSGTARHGCDGTMFPWAYVAVPLAILPALLVRTALKRSLARHKKGLCPRCGYDLRATPQRCPECGHSMTGDAATPSRALGDS